MLKMEVKPLASTRSLRQPEQFSSLQLTFNSIVLFAPVSKSTKNQLIFVLPSVYLIVVSLVRLTSTPELLKHLDPK